MNSLTILRRKGLAKSAYEYGAKGDNSTDDTAALQTAINDTTRDLIMPADGVFKITSPLLMTAQFGKRILGGGLGSGYGPGATLKWSGTAYVGVSPLAALWMQSCRECEIDSLGIQSNGNRLAEGLRITSNAAIGIGSTRNMFRRVRIDGGSDSIETGIRIGGFSSGLAGAGVVDANNDFHVFDHCQTINYGFRGVSIDDSQAGNQLFRQLLGNNAGWRTSNTGSMTAGSTTLSFTSGFLTQKDVGKLVEVHNAWPNGANNGNPNKILRARIISIDSLTTATLGVASFYTTGASQTIRIGPQNLMYSAWSSYEMLGGFGANNLDCDILMARTEGLTPSKITQFASEGSRALYVGSGSLANAIELSHIRWAGFPLAITKCNGIEIGAQTINYQGSGYLDINDCQLMDPENWAPIQLRFNGGGSTMGRNAVLRNCYISSTLPVSDERQWYWNPGDDTERGAAQIWQGGSAPVEVHNCILSTPSGVKLLGSQPREYSPLAPEGTGIRASVTTSVTINFTYGEAATIALGGDTTFTLVGLRIGVGTPHILEVLHKLGPWVMTWPAAVNWGVAGAPTGTSAKTDIYEFRYDGTTIFGRILGSAY